ncbi:MAG: threonine synthase, partial [Spirochaetales bacterium]
FIAATNINKVVPEYLKTGTFQPRPSLQTLSNAMDVGNPSNFERLLKIFEGRHSHMQKQIEGIWVNDEETLETISRYHSQEKIFLDPHTALGVKAAERYIDSTDSLKDACLVTLGTAHPGKFLEIVEQATGRLPPLPPQLVEVMNLPKQALLMENRAEALKSYLLDTFGS